MLSFLFLILAMDVTTEATYNLSKFDIFSTDIDYIVNEDQIIAIILDGREKVLLLIGPQGELIAKCGRKGEGPREFQSPDSVWWDPEVKAFSVFDSGNRRISRWHSSGHFISATSVSHRLKNPRQHDRSTLFFTRNERGIFEHAPAIMCMDLGTGEAKPFWEVGDAPFRPPTVRIGNATMVVSSAWDPLLTYGLGEDFVALSDTGQGTVNLFDLKGRLRKRISPPLKQYAVSDEEIDAQIESSFAVARSTLQSKRKQLYEGKSWPAIRSLMVDTDQRIWVIGQRDRQGAAFPIFLYDASGALITKTSAPFEPTFVIGKYLYFLREQSDQIFLEKATFSI